MYDWQDETFGDEPSQQVKPHAVINQDAEMVHQGGFAKELLVGDKDTYVLASPEEFAQTPESMRPRIPAEYAEHAAIMSSLEDEVPSTNSANRATQNATDGLGAPMPGSISTLAGVSGQAAASPTADATQTTTTNSSNANAAAGQATATSTQADEKLTRPDDLTSQFAAIKETSTRQRRIIIQGDPDVTRRFYDELAARDLVGQGRDGVPHIKASPKQMEEILKKVTQDAGHAKGESYAMQHVLKLDGEFTDTGLKAKVRNWMSDAIDNDKVANLLKLRSTVDVFVVGNESTRKAKIEEVSTLMGALADKDYLRTDADSVERAGLKKGENLNSATISNYLSDEQNGVGARPLRLSGNASLGVLTALAADKVAAFNRQTEAEIEKKKDYNDKTAAQGLANAQNATDNLSPPARQAKALSEEIQKAFANPDSLNPIEKTAGANEKATQVSGEQPTQAGQILEKAWQLGSYENAIGKLPQQERQEMLVALKVLVANAEVDAYGKEAKALLVSSEPGSLSGKLDSWLKAETKVDATFASKAYEIEVNLHKRGLAPEEMSPELKAADAAVKLKQLLNDPDKLKEPDAATGKTNGESVLAAVKALPDYESSVGAMKYPEQRQELLVSLKALEAKVDNGFLGEEGKKAFGSATVESDVRSKLASWLEIEKTADSKFAEKAGVLAKGLEDRNIITADEAAKMGFPAPVDKSQTKKEPKNLPPDSFQLVEPRGRKEPFIGDTQPAVTASQPEQTPSATAGAEKTQPAESAPVETGRTEASNVVSVASAEKNTQPSPGQPAAQAELEFGERAPKVAEAVKEPSSLGQPNAASTEKGVTGENVELAQVGKASPDAAPKAEVLLREPKETPKTWQDKGYKMSPEQAVENVSEILEKPAYHLTKQNKSLDQEGLQRLVDSVAHFDTETKGSMSAEDRQVMARAASMLDTRIKTNRFPGISAESEIAKRIHDVAQATREDARPVVPTDIEKDLNQQMNKIEGVLTRANELAKQRGAGSIGLDDSFGDSRTKDLVLAAFQGKEGGQTMDEARVQHGIEKSKQGSEEMGKNDTQMPDQQDMAKPKGRSRER